MRKYPNLPSIDLELLDGNLRIDRPITGPVVMVVGTAVSGPANVQYLGNDSNEAAAVFGSDSPLIQKMSEAKLGGAKNVLLYRVGGNAAQITDLFGVDTLISTREQTVVSGSKYAMYIGPSPLNPAVAGLIIFEGDTVVYSNMAGAEVDLNRFVISGFDDAFAYVVGTPSAPVPMADILSSITEAATTTGTGDTVVTTFPLPAATVEITSATLSGTLIPDTDYALVGTDIVFAVAPAAGPLEFLTQTAVDPLLWADVPVFTAGADNIGCSWEKYYELLDRAYADLETTIATHLVTDRAIIDAPNLAEASPEADKLTYLRTEEVNGLIEYVWGIDKLIYIQGGTGETNMVGLADTDENGQPIIKYRFHEVNFGHQMGKWLHDITENDRFVLGSIGTSGPVISTTSGLAKWIGSLPEKDASGLTTLSGTGLLGNRFMSGDVSQRDGFFLTDSGYADGNVLVDSNGAAVDLGKFMSVVMGRVVLPNSTSLGTAVSEVNAAALYTGALSTVVAGNSTTNSVIPRVQLPFVVKKGKLNDLAYAGFVSLASRSRGTVVVSGELATGFDSDYDYVSTAIIVANVVSKIRTRLDPFLGKGLNQITLAAIDTAVEGIFQESVGDGSVVKYAYQVLSDTASGAKGFLMIPITIVPAFELREISVPIKLAYDI